MGLSGHGNTKGEGRIRRERKGKSRVGKREGEKIRGLALTLLTLTLPQ